MGSTTGSATVFPAATMPARLLTSWTSARTSVRKLPIPNAICRDQEGHLYGVPTEAILDRVSNAAAVQTRWPPRLRGVASPKTDLTRSTNGLRGDLWIISSKRTSGQLPESASGVGRCSTADESHAEPHAPITAGLLVIRDESTVGGTAMRAILSGAGDWGV